VREFSRSLVENDDSGDLVERSSSEFFGPDHLRDEGSDGREGEGESRSEVREGKGRIERCVGEEVCSESFFLDFPEHNGEEQACQRIYEETRNR